MKAMMYAMVVAAVLVCATGAWAVDIALVTVGDPGNDGELSGESVPGGYGPDRVCGAVGYVYGIGMYEVTAGQYAEFLNAVAAADTYGLYDTAMWSDPQGCKIERSGLSGDYTYAVAPDRMNRPVNLVSWGDAARFANWLHNGQPTGTQDLTTTEDGSYLLNGAMTDSELMSIARCEHATFVIPSEDEWYKAAYYDGAANIYANYPTGAAAAPGYVTNSGMLSGTGAPFVEGETDPGGYATYNGDGGTGDDNGIGPPYFSTEVGEWESSPSMYGTFDQGGNVWEWNEAVLDGSARGARGGGIGSDFLPLRASYRATLTPPSYEHSVLGFRVALVPEPSSLGMLAVGILVFVRRRRGRPAVTDDSKP